jgi:hypothetical protein
MQMSKCPNIMNENKLIHHKQYDMSLLHLQLIFCTPYLILSIRPDVGECNKYQSNTFN